MSAYAYNLLWAFLALLAFLLGVGCLLVWSMARIGRREDDEPDGFAQDRLDNEGGRLPIDASQLYPAHRPEEPPCSN